MIKNSGQITIVGIYPGGALGIDAIDAIHQADLVIGAPRHRRLFEGLYGSTKQSWHPWPRPLMDCVDWIKSQKNTTICLVASGDPMFYGVGASLSRLLDGMDWRVIPAPSSFSQVTARLKWPLQDCTLTSLHARPISVLHPLLAPGSRIIALTSNGQTPTKVARYLCSNGYGDTLIHVLENIGTNKEKQWSKIASAWPSKSKISRLNTLALECTNHPSVLHSVTPGLSDDAFIHNGQITKQDQRAMTLAHLMPLNGQCLWDIGAGCGSIAIEWMRAHPRNRAICVEKNVAHCTIIRRNAKRLGTPSITIIQAQAPDILPEEVPDAIFIGGSINSLMLGSCWSRLKTGGRLVANAITAQAQGDILAFQSQTGGAVSLVNIAHLDKIKGSDRLAFRPSMPLMRYIGHKTNV